MGYDNMLGYRTLAPRVKSPRTLEPPTQPDSVSPKQRRRHHSVAAWEAQKPAITRLYLCENRSAKEVVRILQKNFNFDVRLRKLRNKLQEWGVRKTGNHSDGNLRAPGVRVVTTDGNGDTSPLARSLSQARGELSCDTSTDTSEVHVNAASESLDDHHEESLTENSSTLPLKTYCLEEISEGHKPKHHHILKDRSVSPEGHACCSNGPPQNSQSPTTVFQASVRCDRVDITIFSENLYYGLRSLFPLRLWEEGRRFSGQLLLMNYTRLKTQLERLRTLVHPLSTASSVIEELELLVDGFVGNRSAFRHFDFKDPSIYCVLDNQLRAAFAQQELDDGIESLNEAFFDIDQLFPEGDDQIGVHNMRAEAEIALQTASPKRFEQEPTTVSHLEPIDPCPEDDGISESPSGSTVDDTGLNTQTIDASWDTPRRKRRAVDIAQDPKIREQERLKLQRFRKRFIRQYLLLKQATKDSFTELYQLSAGLRSYKDAWAIAMRTMRQLVRLKVPSLLGALCFLCTARAMADSVSDKEDAYRSEFTQDLMTWQRILPGIEDAVWLIWNIRIDPDLELLSLPPREEISSRHLLQQLAIEGLYSRYESNALQRLRESVAGLVSAANETFGLETEPGLKSWQQIDKRQSPADTKHSTPQATRWDIEPPDILIAPNALFLKNKFQGTPCFNIVLLVTGIMFALVVLFILGFSSISSSTSMGYPNPWYTEPDHVASTCRSFGEQETFDPALLSRPSTPFDQWQPCPGAYSAPNSTSVRFSSDHFMGGLE